MKKVAATLILLFVVFSVYCVSVSVYFPSKTTKKPIYPSDNKIGQIVDKSDSENNSNLVRMLSNDFSFEWTEANFHPDCAKALSAVYSEFLSQHLPASDFVMSKQLKNADNSASIAVRFSDGKVATFVISDNKICGMSI